MGNSKTKEFETLADVLSFGLWQTYPESAGLVYRLEQNITNQIL